MSPGVIPTYHSIPSHRPSISASLGPGNPEGLRKDSSNNMSIADKEEVGKRGQASFQLQCKS